MAYMIRITRNADGENDGATITLAEWVDAVNRIPQVRLADGDYSVTLPETGQVFTLRNTGGDTDLYFPYFDAWQRSFRWDEKEIAFVGTEEFASDPACRLRTIARQLAEALQASVVGDDGEIYA